MTEYTRENMPDDLRWLAIHCGDMCGAKYISREQDGFMRTSKPFNSGDSYTAEQHAAARQTLDLDVSTSWDEAQKLTESEYYETTEEEDRAWAEKYGKPDMEPDMVNHPPHYTQGGIECIEAIRAALTPEEFRGYCKGAALKYIWRERHKGGDESMRKAVWYINKELAE